MTLSQFKVFTFDCYGTLIDWELGLRAALQPLSPDRDPGHLLPDFAEYEAALQAQHPDWLYPDILAAVYRRLAARHAMTATDQDVHRFGQSIAQWPAFGDSAAALRRLQRHGKLIVLSNIDNASFAASAAQLGVTFDAVYTAQDIGSYKPDPRNFRYLIDRVAELGHPPGEILHIAQSLYHDHAPAQTCGLKTAWIDRRHGQAGDGATKPMPDRPAYDYRFDNLADLVEFGFN